MSLFVATCGPTGVGKTFQMERLIRQDPKKYTAVLSVTTRPSRGVEDEGWYRFVTRDEISTLDPNDILSEMEFRGERYLLLRSEIDKALARASIAFMAIVPSVIMRLRTEQVPHLLLNCRADESSGYEAHLVRRGYQGKDLVRELETGRTFEYPPTDPAWPEVSVFLGSDTEDNSRFDMALTKLTSFASRA